MRFPLTKHPEKNTKRLIGWGPRKVPKPLLKLLTISLFYLSVNLTDENLLKENSHHFDTIKERKGKTHNVKKSAEIFFKSHAIFRTI